MNKTTIPKKRILSSFIDDSKKLNYYECIYEWFSNMAYSNSKNTFINIRNETGYDGVTKQVIYYAMDSSIDRAELDALISFKSSNVLNDEIGHHGDGFKRFSYKHLGEMEVYSIDSNGKTYRYLRQYHNKLSDLIDNDVSNVDFERQLDTSIFTTFSEQRLIDDLPSRIINYVNSDLPFPPKFIVRFTDMKNEIEEFTNSFKFEALKLIIETTNYSHIDSIYFKNELDGTKDENFIKLNRFDMIGNSNVYLRYKMDWKLYVHSSITEENVYYISYLGNLIKIKGNKNLGSDGIVLDELNHICDISIRELNDNFRNELKNLTKRIKDIKNELSLEYLPHQEEKYTGAYIMLNNTPINFKPCENGWLSKPGNLPGRSRYRCIIEPRCSSYIAKLIRTEGIKSSTRFSTETDWLNIVNKHINGYFKKYRDKYTDTIAINKALNFNEDLPTNPNPLPKKGKPMNVYILKLGDEIYKFGNENGDLTNKRDEIISNFKESFEQDLELYENDEAMHYIYIGKVTKVRNKNYQEEFEEVIEEGVRVEIYDDYFRCSNENIFKIIQEYYNYLYDEGLNY
jgi:hypothetical protein